MDVKYDFKSEANRHKWDKILIESLEKILSEVHSNLTLTEAAADYIQELILSNCLYPICTTFSNETEDIKKKIVEKFPYPLNNWAVHEAEQMIQKKPKNNGKGNTQGKEQFLLPYPRLRALICKEFFQKAINEVNEDVIWLIAGCVEFLCVDLLRLIGSFVKNLKGVEVKVEDVKNALCADKVLLELLEVSRDVNDRTTLDDFQFNQEWMNLERDKKTEKYCLLVKRLLAEERQNQRNIQMIIYVFIGPLEKLDNGPKEKFDEIFFTIHSLHEISNQFLPKLEETIEFFGNETPLVGDYFLEFGELMSLSPYVSFAHHIADDQNEYLQRYNDFLSHKAIQTYFAKTKKELGYCASEVYKYVLPRLMYNLVSHAAQYYEVLNQLISMSPDEKDRYELKESLSCMKPHLNELKGICECLPKREIYFRFVPKPIDSEAMLEVDGLLKSLTGIDDETRRRMYHSGSEIIMKGEWQRVSGSDKKSRRVYLLDGYILCCRKKGNQTSDFRVKEWFRMREIEILDHIKNQSAPGDAANGTNNHHPESQNGSGGFNRHQSLTFQIKVVDSVASSSSHSPPLVFHHHLHHGKQSSEGYIYMCDNYTDKQDWMVAMLSIHSRGTLERILDKYIAEEEKKQPLRFPAPDKYCFAEPDKKEGDVNIITDSKSGVSKVKEATLPKLVERLTFHLHADHAYIEDFFTTYRSFCEPSDLLNLLKIRFNIPDIEPTEEEKQTYATMESPSVRKFKKEYAHPVQSRVLNVIRYWINNHYDDFKKDPALLSSVHSFIQQVSENKKWKNYCASIQKIMKNQAEHTKKKPETVHNENPPRVEWHLATPHDPSTYNLITLHPLEIARQITLIESEMFRNVTLSELTNFGCCSSKDRDQKRRMFPNVVAWQNFNNKISYWFTFSVLDTPLVEERMALLIRGWEIAQALEELNNFSGVLHVISGLNYSSVSRLKLTHEKLPKETKDIKHRLISKYIDSNLKFYKDALKKTNPPLVPYLGNTFTNVLHIEDSARTHTSSNLINFSKCRLISTQCRAIMMYQPMPYNLQVEHSIQKYLKGQDPVGSHTESEWADKLHAMSLQIEPRDSNFSLKPPSSKSVEKKFSVVSLKSPGIKPTSASSSSKMMSKWNQSKMSVASSDQFFFADSKITTYTKPSLNNSQSSTRSRSSLSNSNNSESTSPVPPGTPKSSVSDISMLSIASNHQPGQFATIGSPCNLLEQKFLSNKGYKGGTRSLVRNSSGGSSASIQSDVAFFPQHPHPQHQGGSLNHRFGHSHQRYSTSSMSSTDSHMSLMSTGGSFSASSRSSIATGSNCTLVSNDSMMSLSSRPQNSPSSELTPPMSGCSSGGNSRSPQCFTFNHPSASTNSSLSITDSGPQISPASTMSEHFTYPQKSPPGSNSKPPPVPPRKPLDADVTTPTRSSSNDYSLTPGSTMKKRSPPENTTASPEKIPPRTPLGTGQFFTPPSSTLPRSRGLSHGDHSLESKQFSLSGGKMLYTGDSINSLDSSPQMVFPRRSMIESSSSGQDILDEKVQSSKFFSKSPMPPPRRSELSSVSSTTAIESSQFANTTPPPEIPAKTYRFPATQASS